MDSIWECVFLLTRPSRDVTGICPIKYRVPEISTHTPLAGRDKKPTVDIPLLIISTHTPLAGRDEKLQDTISDQGNFYSHAPRGT